MIERIKKNINYFLKIIRLNKINSQKIFMFDIPGIYHHNIGDNALAIAEKKFITENFSNKDYVEILDNEIDTKFFKYMPVPNKNDIICIQSGGYLGTLWIYYENITRLLLKKFKNYNILIFPQTVYYSNDDYGKEQLKISQEIYKQCSNLNIFAREQYSYELFKKYFPSNNIFLAPDMALYLDSHQTKYNRKNILLCLRNDKEKTQNYDNIIKKNLEYLNENILYTDTIENNPIGPKNREKILTQKLDEFAKAKLIITDRLHGMIFAALSETPCVVILSQSHKVKGVYQWIKHLEYIELVEDISKFNGAVDRVLEVKNPTFDNKTIKNKFEPLIKKLQEELD